MVLIAEITAAETLDLRSRVLRDGADHNGFPEDDLPGTFHIGARDGEAIVGVATFVPRGEGFWQLRGMAVEPAYQGRGVGATILEFSVATLRQRGARRVWANGRDTALGFYQRAGWTVVGEGYVLPVHEGRPPMPHHRVELDVEAS